MTLSSILFAVILCVALVGAGVLWCRKMRVSTGHQHFKEIARSLINYARVQHLMELEMERARRLEYKLAVIVIRDQDPAEPKMAAANDELNIREENGSMETRIVDVLRDTSLLRETLRMIDITAYDEERQFVVIMLLGVDSEQAAHTVYRIRKRLQRESSEDMQIGCAGFSDDGLLLDDLISCALSRAGQSETVLRVHPRVKIDAAK